MIGAILGGAMKIGGAIFGGIAKRKAAKKQAKILSQQKAENKTWYDRRYNEDSTQRADAQRAMQMMRDAMQERAKRSTASAAVTGATDESLAMEKAAANNALSATTGNIVAQGDARKDAIEQQYMARNAEIAQGEMGLAQQKAQNISDAVGQVSSMASPLSNLFGNK